MPLFWLSALIVIGVNVGYHVCQKSIPPAAHVIVSVIVTFVVAIVVSFFLLCLCPAEGGILSAVRKVGWASVLRGLAVIGIEAGYLLLYRSGWRISLGPVFCYACVVVLLILIGMLFFKEKFTLAHGLGVFLALGGVYLITRASG